MTKARAYFDESGTNDDSPTISIAGYIFTEKHDAAFQVQWQKMLDKWNLPYFHTVHCNHGTGIFKSFSGDERIAIQTRAIELTKQFASKGIALSLDKSIFDRIAADGTWSSPYTFLCGQVFYGVRDWANDVGFKGEIEYIFESGADGWGTAADEIKRVLVSTDAHRREFRYAGHFTRTKTEALPLQSADLLAWHYHTYNRRRREGVKKKRADFKSLIERRIDPHHYELENVEGWIRDWAQGMEVARRILLTVGQVEHLPEIIHCPVDLLLDLVHPCI